MLNEALLSRERLLNVIANPSLAPITLVTAPAGYGKSTLVRQWARRTSHPVAWVTLGPESNHPDRFRAQLVSAVNRALPETDGSASDDDSLDRILQALDTTVQAGGHPVVVFDDFHLVENRDVHEAVAGLLGRLPHGSHVVLISRTMPPLPLGRMQAEGAVRHLTGDDLRFSPDETAAIVKEQAPDRLTKAQLKTLGDRTDGWIAGVRLALASLEQVDSAAVPSLIDAWPVSQWLDDYIVEEVLSTLSDELREFVLRTSTLPQLTPDLCNAVLGIETSAALLDEVRRRLVFVRSADGGGDLISWHPLFAESASRIADRTWPVSDRLDRHRRAALWYEAHGQLEAAVEQAVAAEDWELAVRCVRPLAKMLMDMDASHSRLYWLGKLPEDRVLADPDLAHWYISALQYSGQLREAQRLLAVAVPMWEASSEPAHLGHAARSHVFVADVNNNDADQALHHAYEALAHYPPTHAVEILHALTAIMSLEYLKANDDAVEQAYRRAVLCREQLPEEQVWWATHVGAMRVDQLALRGNLLAARNLAQQSLEQLPTIYANRAGKFQLRLAAISLEQNDLAAAAGQMEAIERAIGRFKYHSWHPDGLLVIARVLDALGDAQRAQATLDRTHVLHQQHGGMRHQSRLDAVRADLWLRAGQVELAQAWAARVGFPDGMPVRTIGDPDPRVVLARVALAAGEPDLASERLRMSIERARDSRRWAELVPLCVWQVVARLELGDDECALASLRLALQHGMPGGFVRSFMTPGYNLMPFLLRVGRALADDERIYLHCVLIGSAGLSGPTARPKAPPGPLPESHRIASILSAREQEVLDLIRSGCANAEIATRLFISERTVRKHVSNSLQKLGVPNRTAAVMRAVELGLLKP